MGSIWLRDLDEIVGAAGLDYRCWGGWENRARSSGGYTQLWGVVIHHTASNTAPDNDARYMWETGDNRPIGAVLLERTGRVTIGAAGATNTAGKGGPWTTSKGTVPVDCGNTYTFNIEAANAGTGEPWPRAQQDAYLRLCRAVCDAYGFDPARDICAHWEWTPGRKIDPAGDSDYALGAASWDMDRFRRDVTNRTPAPEEDDVTQDDINKIADAVWKHMVLDPPTQKQITAESLLGYARHSAANADAQTKK